jgi:hypothetical protein
MSFARRCSTFLRGPIHSSNMLSKNTTVLMLFLCNFHGEHWWLRLSALYQNVSNRTLKWCNKKFTFLGCELRRHFRGEAACLVAWSSGYGYCCVYADVMASIDSTSWSPERAAKAILDCLGTAVPEFATADCKCRDTGACHLSFRPCRTLRENKRQLTNTKYSWDVRSLSLKWKSK